MFTISTSTQKKTSSISEWCCLSTPKWPSLRIIGSRLMANCCWSFRKSGRWSISKRESILSSSLSTNEAATTTTSEFAKSWPIPYNGSCLTVVRVLNKNSKSMKNCRKISLSTISLSLILLQPCISLPPTLISIYHFYNKWISQFIIHPRCIGN